MTAQTKSFGINSVQETFESKVVRPIRVGKKFGGGRGGKRRRKRGGEKAETVHSIALKNKLNFMRKDYTHFTLRVHIMFKYQFLNTLFRTQTSISHLHLNFKVTAKSQQHSLKQKLLFLPYHSIKLCNCTSTCFLLGRSNSSMHSYRKDIHQSQDKQISANSFFHCSSS